MSVLCSWVLDPLALAVSAAAAALVHGRRRELREARQDGHGRDGWLLLGATVLVLALVSPVGALSGDLLSVHMVQHLLLVVVAAPLVAAGDPGPAILRTLPAGERPRMVAAWRRSPRWMRRPGGGTVVGGLGLAVALWAWHLPALHELAVQSWPVHVVEHTTLLVAAVTFWAGVVRRRARPRQVLLPVLLTSVVVVVAGGTVGALLTFAGTELYGAYRPEVWDVAALSDQRIAGLLLWVTGGPAFALAAAAAVVRGIGADEDLASSPPRAGARPDPPPA